MHTVLLSCAGMLQARRHETTHISLCTIQVVVIEVHRLCITVFTVLCPADYGKFNICPMPKPDKVPKPHYSLLQEYQLRTTTPGLGIQ